MNQQTPAKSSSSLFTIIGLSLLILGGGLWLMLNSSNKTDANTPAADVQLVEPVADHGDPIPDRLATIKGNVVHLTKWNYDLDKAFASSKETGKPVLMMLTADWCGPCQMLKKDVLSLPEVDEQIQAKFTPVVWDLTEPSDTDIKRAQDWGAGAAIPEVIMFDASGKPIKHKVGAVSQAEFIKWLNAG
jgi:protein disulfide-isomerase